MVLDARAYTASRTTQGLGIDGRTHYVLAGAAPVLVHNCNENIISNADGFDDSAELSRGATGDFYSGVYDPNGGVFYA
ncbi:hypothetical protein [Streptomyces niveus]|uniref:hypothetical protein n=1 Tax=Streptomyces niveus TaxID=193462 RepID=UPI0034215590